ncbi:hypothetical protein G6F32_015549 [Rhizopus arrhizus]|nr:hypothetical protein G6F32_015549 [Rhizopus arrhizus]
MRSAAPRWSSAAGGAPTSSSASASTVPTVMATVPWASRARSADDRVDGPARGVGLAPGVAIPRPPRGDTLINPDWAYVDSRDKGAMLRGELDINDNLMAYLAYGTSKTDYRYNARLRHQEAVR